MISSSLIQKLQKWD